MYSRRPYVYEVCSQRSLYVNVAATNQRPSCEVFFRLIWRKNLTATTCCTSHSHTATKTAVSLLCICLIQHRRRERCMSVEQSHNVTLTARKHSEHQTTRCENSPLYAHRITLSPDGGFSYVCENKRSTDLGVSNFAAQRRQACRHIITHSRIPEKRPPGWFFSLCVS